MSVTEAFPEIRAPEDIPRFEELPKVEQAFLLAEAAPYFLEEKSYFGDEVPYADMARVEQGVGQGHLVAAVTTQGQYRVVSPIRDRIDLPPDPAEGSIPYLSPSAKFILDCLTADVKDAVLENNRFTDNMERAGYDDVALSVTSLLRISPFQARLAAAGKFAVGADGQNQMSVHEIAQAFDIDHAGFYVRHAATGEILGLNREAKGRDFTAFAKLLPDFKQALREAVQCYVDEDKVMTLEEIPHGWGVWHVAVKC